MQPRYKGLLIILDGVGDRPAAALGGSTPLEAANTPQLDRLVSIGRCGLVDPLAPGVPVGTHVGTGCLMGLARKDAYALARGPVEASGVGLPMQPGDVALRANFATLAPEPSGYTIVNRRAGRIREGTDELAAALENVPLGDGITATLCPATQHRAVVRLSGDGLSPDVGDTDPGGGANPSRVVTSCPLDPDDVAGARTADALNQFIGEAFDRLRQHRVNKAREAQGLLPANGILTRGSGALANVRNLINYRALNTAVVSGEHTVVGLARMFGFTVHKEPAFTSLPDTDLAAKVAATRAALDAHDLVYLHIKGTDTCSHDHNPEGKKAFLERIDEALAPLLTDDIVIGVSADHSTDCNTGRHIGDPVPSLLYAPTGRRDLCRTFGETECLLGGLSRISSTSFLASMLDAMGALENYRPADADYFCL